MAGRKKNIKKKRPYLRLMIFAVLVCIVSYGTYFAIDYLGISEWGEFDPDKIINTQQSLHVFDMDNNEIANISGEQKRDNVALKRVPEHVINAFLAAEDVRFYSHMGIDVKRIAGALWADIKSGSYTQGASTISQQLIKLSHLTSIKTMGRKLQEAYLAYQMEQVFTKDEILEMYLNFIYFGNGAYGIEAASQSYFSKGVEELTLAEGAMLAGIIKSPSKYSPHINLENSIARRNLILGLMEQYGFITESEKESAKKDDVELKLSESRDGIKHGYFVDEVMIQARQMLGVDTEELISAGYRIYTTLDVPLQTLLEELMENNEFFPQNSEDGTPVQGAIASVDPKTGEVRALVGGRSYTTRFGFNRAISLARQPGSAIKPVMVYAPALESGLYSTTSFVLDEPTEFNDYAPKNFGDSYMGWVTMRTAVAKSLNVPAVKILNDVGINRAKAYASSVGIAFSEGDNHLALALGGFETGLSPLTLASAYQPFASGGYYSAPVMIRRIEDSEGRLLYDCERAEPKHVLSEENAFLVSDLLSSVVDDGTAKVLKDVGISISAKSGTVDEPGVGNRDIWMVAYNSDYIFSVWMGYDNPSKEHYIPREITGGTLPAKLLAQAFESLYPDREAAPAFVPPSTLTMVALDKKALEHQELELANEYTPNDSIQYEYFRQEGVPDTQSVYWQPPSAPSDVTVRVDSANTPIISFTAVESAATYRVIRQSLFMPDTVLDEVSGDVGERLYVRDKLPPVNSATYYVQPIRYDIVVNNTPLKGAMVEAEDTGAAEPVAPVNREPDSTDPSATSAPIYPLPSGSTDEPQVSESPAASGTPQPTENPASTPEPTAAGNMPLLPIN